MRFWPGTPIRHPFYPKLRPVRAAEAKGECAALAGTFPELEAAAAAGVVPTRMVLVLHEERAPFLTSEQRDRLWSLFEVPVYAMVLNGKRRLIGFECEAQNGLHAPGEAPSSTCACGRPGLLIQTEAANEVSAAARLLPEGV